MATPRTGNAQIAAIYTRVSTEEQAKGDHLSLETQERACRAKAADKGFVIDERYVVQEKHSGSDLRWEGTKLMWLAREAEHGAFDVLICYSSDRFCRGGPEAYFDQEQRFERAEVDVIHVMFDLPPDMPYRRTFLTFQSEHYEQENADRLERSMRVKRRQAEGHLIIPGSHPPYGHRYVGTGDRRVLVEDPETAPILRRLYQHVADGGTLLALAATLRREQVLRPRMAVKRKQWEKERQAALADGAPDPGDWTHPRNAYDWSPMTICHILRNSTNWGERTSFVRTTVQRTPEERAAIVPGRGTSHKTKKKTVRVASEHQYQVGSDRVPALIPRELAMRALDQLAQNKALSSRTARPEAERLEKALLFGGPVRCGACGRAMRVKHNPSCKVDLYACNHRQTPYSGEPQVTVSIRYVDEFAWKQACRAMRDEDYLRRLAEKTDAVAGPIAQARDAQARLANLDRDIARQKKTQAKLDPDNPDDEEGFALIAREIAHLARQRATLERELESMQAAIAAEEQRQAGLRAFQTWAHEQGTNLESFTRSDQRRILLAMRTQIIVARRGPTPRLRLLFDIRTLSGAAALIGDRYRKPSFRINFGSGAIDTVELLGVHGHEKPLALDEIATPGPEPWEEMGYASEDAWLAAQAEAYSDEPMADTGSGANSRDTLLSNAPTDRQDAVTDASTARRMWTAAAIC